MGQMKQSEHIVLDYWNQIKKNPPLLVGIILGFIFLSWLIVKLAWIILLIIGVWMYSKHKGGIKK